MGADLQFNCGLAERVKMKSEFGDIRLFNRAFEENPDSPELGEYLESVGLTKSEIEDVTAQFKEFSAVIRNADEAELPNIPNPEKATADIRPSVN